MSELVRFSSLDEEVDSKKQKEERKTENINKAMLFSRYDQPASCRSDPSLMSFHEQYQQDKARHSLNQTQQEKHHTLSSSSTVGGLVKHNQTIPSTPISTSYQGLHMRGGDNYRSQF